ncbi:hypothetical protein RND81_02G130100 [Saponaria officinalis]|uniref:Polymerase nucleotidyl transferase domain-containing protein n=1 Tax=Saponaria officinalis TaxID=3572 RepID=A0AAW1MT84_SAPOF
MGEQEEWPLPSGLLLNGLLPREPASVIRVLDRERWAKAEERTAELIACIQPNQPSEDRREAVADYVERLIKKCFPCEVFTFGSVPLKTYLPDGDIDVTAFGENQILKDTWAVQVRDILESEEKNENAEFRVKEVQYIQAEVKIIKCLVENIVVDISFNQLGGLCTLCFLEEVDNLINQDHLFKRSIILIKAWCYYESRILGAHHGLISTYALETLVLYIFHIFNNSLTGPLEVLYRFLEFFSNFDWENFCVSLWGPVYVSSLPDINVEPPRKDGGELLLSRAFLHACNSVYAVYPGGLENQGQPFISKHFNVIDPLRINNNLGRSVNKGNFHRIRSAFAFGAKRLAKLLDCPKENIASELNQFFTNTWARHGSGIRPDAPTNDLEGLRPSHPNDGSDNQLNSSNIKDRIDDASTSVIGVDAVNSTQPLHSQRASYPLGRTPDCNGTLEGSCVTGQKTNGKLSSSRMSGRLERGNLKSSRKSDGIMRSLEHNQMVNPFLGKHILARTRSSPELTDAYGDTSSRLTRIKLAESKKGRIASAKMDSSLRNGVISETASTQNPVSSSNDPSSHHMLDAPFDSTSVSESYIDDSGTVTVDGDHASVIGAQGMHQEEQDLVNMMASSSLHNFGGHIPMPLNLASAHLPRPIPQSVLTSMGYGPRNGVGMFPANFPLIDPRWAANFQFHQGLTSSPLSQYFPGGGMSTNSEALMEHGDENLGGVENRRGADAEYWHERSVFDGTLEVHHEDDRQPSTSGSSNFVTSSRMNSASSRKIQPKLSKEHPASIGDIHRESFQQHDNRVIETFPDERTSGGRYASASQSGSVRSMTSSESSWDGSSARVSKSTRGKRGRKAVTSAAAPSKVQVKGKMVDEYTSSEVDDRSIDCSTLPISGNEIDASIVSSQPTPTLQIGPMVLDPGSHQRGGSDNSGAGPFTFYPTGPPVPFFTMLPVYDYSTEADRSEASSSLPGGEDAPGDISPDILNGYNHTRMSTTGESFSEPKRDILNSDFNSHWQNLQFGRLCQGPRYPAPVVYPSPAAVPPMYLHGHFPWDGPGRPLSANANLLSQLMSYGHRFVPVTSLQSDSSRPSTAYQRFTDESPVHRSGTGTYLPNPKAFVKDRHSSGARRNSYNHDRNDHSDREGNWNTAKSRAAGRNHNRSPTDRPAPNENRADRPWAAYRHQPPPHQAHSGPIRPSSSANMAYGMHPLPGMNPGEVMSNGPTMQSVVMLYPYGQSQSQNSGEQLEFGSLGPVADAVQLRVTYEDQRYHRSSSQMSSPDQPSSPHFQRRV